MQKIVLLIDDDQEELMILDNAFQIAGFECMTKWVSNAEEAFYYLRQVVPDYIFLDLNMPKIDGLTCLQEIKKMHKVQQVPVIFYSTTLDDNTSKRAIQLGASWCIQKTTSVRDLVKSLEPVFAEVTSE